MSDQAHDDPSDKTDAVETSEFTQIQEKINQEDVQKPQGAYQTEKQKSITDKFARRILWSRRMRNFSVPILTFGLLICAAAQAFIYYWTMDQIKRQADAADAVILVTNRSVAVAESNMVYMRRSVAVAESSIALSQQVSEIQKRFAMIETRAYVAFQDTFWVSPPRVGEDFKFRMWYTNLGKTPAKNVVCSADLVIDYAQNFKPFFGNHTKGAIDSAYLLFPGTTLGASQSSTTMWSGGSWKFTQRDSVETIDGGKALFLSFRLTYVDIYGVRHFSESFGYTVHGGGCKVITANSN